MPGPLHGFRIVDLTSNVSGPLATMILGDQGADVIKVEAPDGDSTRSGANRRGGFAASFLNNNRNKRSVVLNLKQPAALDALKRLAATADVFVQNYRPGVAERIGVGEDGDSRRRATHRLRLDQRLRREGTLRAGPGLRPGDTGVLGPRDGAGRRRRGAAAPVAYDPARQADRHHRLAGDHRGALGARMHRRAQHVRLSMLEAVVAFLWPSDMSAQTFVGDEPTRQEAASTIDLIYETADGYITAAVVTDRQWQGLTRALETPEWLEDERFKTPALRSQNIEARLQMTQDVLIGRAPRRNGWSG